MPNYSKSSTKKNSCRCCGPSLDICYPSLNGNINILNRNSPDASSEHHIPLFRPNYLQAIHWFLWWCDLYLWLHCFSCSRGCQQQVEFVRLVGTGKRHISGGVHAGKVSGICTIDDSVISVGWDDKMRLRSQASRSFSEETGLTGQPCHLASCATTTNLVLVITTVEVSLYRGLIKVTSLSVSSQGGDITPPVVLCWTKRRWR